MVVTRAGFAAVLAAATLGVGTVSAVAVPTVAAAATSPDTVALTITPTTTAVGDQVTVVATITNNTSATVASTLGIENPQYATEKITSVSPNARNLQKLIYTGDPQLGPGASVSITVTLVPNAAGTYNFTVYGGITNTDDTYVNGTLTAS